MPAMATFAAFNAYGRFGTAMAGETAVAESASRSAFNLEGVFPRYTGWDPQVPTYCVTPDLDRCMHRFHLSSPFSPSGRYMGFTRLPQEERPPQPGEAAEIVLVDLQSGEQKIIAKTIGWDVQLGAQVQWGATDSELFFNDVDQSNWMPFGVRMNPLSGEKQKLDGTIYSVSPDGKWAASTCLRRIGATQAGYGVVVPASTIPVNIGAVDDDGVYVTDTASGKSKMIASYRRIVEEALPRIEVGHYGPGNFYGFHVKWNAHSDRLMLVLRYMPESDGKRRPMLITMTRDGDDIRVAFPTSDWADKGGNHPNWLPDGENVMMNLNLYGDGERFVQARYDGTDQKVMTDVMSNRGHPSLHPDGRFIITDAYAAEDVGFGDGTAPLWLIDREKSEKKTLVRMNSVTPPWADKLNKAKVMRVDFHPAWDRYTHTQVAFNGVQDGTRRVFVADLSEIVPSTA
jgi:hypothetical protein